MYEILIDFIPVGFVIIYKSESTAHSGSKITPGFAQYYNASTGHVFATMIAYAFNDS